MKYVTQIILATFILFCEDHPIRKQICADFHKIYGGIFLYAGFPGKFSAL